MYSNLFIQQLFIWGWIFSINSNYWFQLCWFLYVFFSSKLHCTIHSEVRTAAFYTPVWKTGRIMPWLCPSVCPSVGQSVHTILSLYISYQDITRRVCEEVKYTMDMKNYLRTQITLYEEDKKEEASLRCSLLHGSWDQILQKRPRFPDFSSTCFEISIWNLVYTFSRWHDMSSLSCITIGSFWPSLQPKVGQTHFLQSWPHKSRKNSSNLVYRWAAVYFST